MIDLSNKTAIVTGAARGMGAETARMLVEAGANVVIGDILDDLGEAVANELGDKARYLHMDVTQEADWLAAVELAESMGPLNVLVNNAAMLFAQSIADTDGEQYMRVVQVNQLGPYLGMRAVLEPMKRAGGGSIINISSIDGLQSKNGLSAYSSTKWALRGLTKSAAIEYGPHNIRVNSVHPGGVFTAMHGGDGGNREPTAADNEWYKNHALPRVGMPVEIARMTRFLASDEASYSTGSEFIVDGGWNAGLRVDMLPGA